MKKKEAKATTEETNCTHMKKEAAQAMSLNLCSLMMLALRKAEITPATRPNARQITTQHYDTTETKRGSSQHTSQGLSEREGEEEARGRLFSSVSMMCWPLCLAYTVDVLVYLCGEE